VQVIIADDGQGFDVNNPSADNLPHFGLTIMRERLESVGGRLEIRSNPAGGTQIIARLPRLLAALEEENIQGIRVLLVDDHPLYLEGLRNLLSAKGLNVVGNARNGLEAQELAQQLSPDLILMDVEMPVCNGLEATRLIKEKLPHLKIVMLTVAADEGKLFTALQNGASGYLLKSLDSTQFFNLLSEVMRGETVLSPKLAAQVLAKFSAQAPAVEKPAAPAEVASAIPDTPTLTTRQLDVLQLVAQGLTNKEIADLLHISERTVKFHVSQILEQLQLRSRYELASYAKQQRLLSSDN
jgi:DNA-binding NarL/FixJ family response regulator